MDVNLNSNESLLARIRQLEHASLEQEIDNLKQKLAACTRENLNLQEELSEAYRIKSQLADLHQAEVAKNMEAEKQLKFFQGCVASAFAERDHSLMEAEKAKEKEELMSQKYNDFQNRLEELTSDCLEQKRLNDALKIDLAKEVDQSENFKKVVNKFYEIRQHSLDGFEDTSWDDKCACLLHDSTESWSYNDPSTSKYISALEEELGKMRKSADNLQSKLRMGLEIEKHLKKRVRELENKQICLGKMIVNGITELRHYHSQHRVDIMNLLNEERFHIKSTVDMLEEKVGKMNSEKALGLSHRTINLHENQCRDVQLRNEINTSLSYKESKNGLSDTMTKGEIGEDNLSEVLAQAMQEKIAALLLLSQQEERHLLERNVNAALQNKLEELQRNLLQVTNEKVKALMELAQLKQEYQHFQEKTWHEIQQGISQADTGGKKIFPYDRDGRLRNLLKKTYLRRWIGESDLGGTEGEEQVNSDGNTSSKRFNNIDFARMKIENATLKESLESMDHLTSSIHRLRLALLKVKESVACELDTDLNTAEALRGIISEAKLLKTALGSSLPISWSAETDDTSDGGSPRNAVGDSLRGSSVEKIDSVSAIGFEMVELLILAAQVLEESPTRKDFQD